MSVSQSENRALELLSDALRKQEPPRVTTSTRNAMILRAAQAARRSYPRPSRAPWIAAGLAAAAVALLAFGLEHFADSSPESRAPTPLAAVWSFALPTGDRVSGTTDADFDLTSTTTDRRTLELRSGALLLDVEPLGAGERFQVQTPAALVTVQGTVFLVRATEGHTDVHVFEGQVEVVGEGTTRILSAGEALTTAGSFEPNLARLFERGREAAARRASGQRRASLEPTIETAPEAPPTTRVVPSATTPPPASLARARRLIVQGHLRRALTTADAALADAPADGSWLMVRADALRGLSRHREAAGSYDRAAQHLPRSERVQAGYLAAWTRAREIGNPAGALTSLDRSRADDPTSPIEERALLLRARLLVQLDRTAAARPYAERYLLRYPDGGSVAWMRRLVDGSQ